MYEIAGYNVPDRVFAYMSAGRAELGTTRFDKYAERMKYEHASIVDWLPNQCYSVLDIGCGLGGIDIELARKSGTGITHLLDGDGTGERKNGLKDAGKPWGDVFIAHDFVRANVSPSHMISTHYPWHAFLDKVDLIVSIRSWAHHYPAETYIELAKTALLPGGRVIVDVRHPRKGDTKHGTQVFEEQGFRFLGVCAVGPKCSRIVYDRKEP